MTSVTHTIDGAVAPGFEPVRDAFAANFARFGERGAACAVYADGRLVVDLWGGEADHTTGRPWTADTLSVIWSATKGAVGVLVNLLAQRGELDLDAPMARYWPEFARSGKDGVTVRMVLSHQAGLPVIDGAIAATMTCSQSIRWPSGSPARPRCGGRAPTTAITRSPTGSCSARSSAGRRDGGSVRPSPRRWPRRWASTSGSGSRPSRRAASPA